MKQKDESEKPRRRLQVARETLRQLGARTLRNAAGAQGYFTGTKNTEDFTCADWACTENCPTAPDCETGLQCMTLTNDAACYTQNGGEECGSASCGDVCTTTCPTALPCVTLYC